MSPIHFSFDDTIWMFYCFQESVSSKDVLDVKLEMLLRQWNKSIDILFTIHPVDGSLITWLVEFVLMNGEIQGY